MVQTIACEPALHLGDIVKSRRARGDAKAAGRRVFAARSRVLARIVSFAQTGELARRLLLTKTRKGKACEEALHLGHIVNRRRVCSQASQANGKSPGVKPKNSSPR